MKRVFKRLAGSLVLSALLVLAAQGIAWASGTTLIEAFGVIGMAACITGITVGLAVFIIWCFAD